LLIADWKISKISNRRNEFLQSTIKNQMERGQAVAHFAILIPVTILFFLGVVDYMVSNARAMDTVAAADLAAHAGAQSITLLPDGTIDSDVSLAQQVATAYFAAQAPQEAALGSVSCGLVQNRPACQVSAAVQSAGWLLPPQWITVHAIGYLAYGVTEDDQ
jgi:hypothetical protein